MSVCLECPSCKATRPPSISNHEWNRLGVFLDPAPIRGKTIIAIKCMRHGRPLFILSVDMECPPADEKKGIIIKP